MRFKQIRYAEAAIRLGSLRRAAVEQEIAQPSLSQQIKRLEEELDVVLFVRHPTGVQATEAALGLVETFRNALRVEEAMRQSVAAFGEIKKGFVRVGAAPTLSRLIMPQAVAKFQDLHPNVRIEIHEAGSHSLRDSVRNGVLDFAVIPVWLDEEVPRLWEVELFRTRYVLCIPKGHPYEGAEALEASDLVGHPMIVHKPGSFSRSLFDELSEQYPLDPVVFADSTDSIIRHVVAGVGVSIVPKVAVDAASQEYATVPFGLEGTMNRVVIVRRVDELPAPASQAMMTLLRQQSDEILANTF